jgi:GNAT superfamily N-acetyltransferase
MIDIQQITDLRHLDKLAHIFDLYRQWYKQNGDIITAKSFLKERIISLESVIFAAFEGDTIVGFTQLYPTFSSVTMQRSWILNDFFVLENQRGKNIGTLILEHAKNFARQTDSKGLYLQTDADNPAQKLYEKLGWEQDMSLQYFWKV